MQNSSAVLQYNTSNTGVQYNTPVQHTNTMLQYNTPIQYIFVLAGGLQDNGEVHEFVKIRLDKAIELYNHYSDFQQCKIIVMGGGTYHKPPILNDSNYVIHESSSCALYLTQPGDVDHMIQLQMDIMHI